MMRLFGGRRRRLALELAIQWMEIDGVQGELWTTVANADRYLKTGRLPGGRSR